MEKEKNKNQNMIEKAIMFATVAHAGQIRKGNPKEPVIVHPLAVGEILRQYGTDENVIIAGYLHDVIEDTNYSLEDIEKQFGQDVAHLVDVASDKDKSKSWEERKQNKIEKTKELTLREKLVIIADKISNIEDLEKIFKSKGHNDFSSFRRGEKEQEWYYRNIYNSLIFNENIENPLFKRLEKSINTVFGRTMEEYNANLENIVDNKQIEGDER